MDKYTVLDKNKIDKLRSDNNGFNGKIQMYLLEYSNYTYFNKKKGWLKKIIIDEPITLTETYEKMLSIRNKHLKKKEVKPKKNLSKTQKMQLLKTPSGIQKLRDMGYKFKLI